MDLSEKYREVRQYTEELCRPLQTEDYVVQPVVDVSPPKWHIGHVTWFFETFVLKPYRRNYKEFNPKYNYVFNSYYETAGARVIRTDRGNLSRPTVEDIYRYRRHVDQSMHQLLQEDLSPELRELVVLGLNHEQQHQELLLTDIKFILGNNPLFPAYTPENDLPAIPVNSYPPEEAFLKMAAGIFEIGFKGEGFCFDNELKRHRVFLEEYVICKNLVTNGEYLDFIHDGGYTDFRHWHSDGWAWVNANKITAPMYWYLIEGTWYQYTLRGLRPVRMFEPVCHISFYEAAAYASWKGMRLPTEFEWEVASEQLDWGLRWEWTESAYLPYPGFSKAPGAIGEYNGKFMVNQKVLRGASEVTPSGHSRNTYRNFFQPNLRWQYTGIRLAQ